MFVSNKADHALITVFGDNEEQLITQAVSVHIHEQDIRILAPTDEETLRQAAQNSVLVFIGISQDNDKNLKYGSLLQNSRLVAADIVAFCLEDIKASGVEVMGKGFDGVVTVQDTKTVEFKRYLATRITKGAQRLAGLIQEEEYRRLNDALSLSPVSMIIFDADKRAVFVSDHYFRAYPKIAPRLIRGLRVYDAFEMMIREEGIGPDDPRHALIRKFWHNLDGTVEFTLDDGTTYRMRAMKLPSNRGTVLVGQNITRKALQESRQKANE